MDDLKIPIRLDGEIRGELRISQEGLMKRFDARCTDPGRLLRLSVYGGGKEGYLGVMEPENGALCLHRKLSRAECARLPETPEYAAEAGERSAPASQKSPPRRPQSRPQSREGDTLWRQVGDGSLYAETPRGRFRAIPAAAFGLPAAGAVERRKIEGVEYLIYPLHEGRI